MAPQPSPPHELWVCELPVVPYREALAVQSDLCARRQRDEVPDILLLLEHPPTYTRGRRAADGELPLGEQGYRERGIEVVPTNRGGRVTYHGPGQLVGYPIVGVGDVVAHVRTLERAIVDALGEIGLDAHARAAEGPDYTGVWVAERKIASIGVHVSHGVATHGFAVNVTNDLTPFSWIVPCGLAGVRMTSVREELASSGRPPGRPAGPMRPAGAGEAHPLLATLRPLLAQHLAAGMARRPRLVPLAALGIDPGGAAPARTVLAA
ncbi:MAG: lipoyl(octanoyl) transferase LipB [Acidobacteriota bacterium]|nr:lipoyl(octanoyl) transferase LipB [Acidobacteriota bacterium]